jgi:TP901 family phage tail tape measure protein
MTSAELQVIISAKDQASAQINKLGGSLGGLGSAAKAAGIAFAAIGAGITAIGGMALNAAAEYEAAMSSIKAVSGATGEEMKTLDALAMKLGKDTVFSAKEAANGIEELLKGGVSIADIAAGAAEAALSLATAGEISLADASGLVANALAIFKLEGKDAVRVVDQMSGAAIASTISVGDYQQSLAACGAVAALYGQTIESTSTAIALMAKNGIKGSDAGTSLKTMFMNLQPTTKTGMALMKQYGLILADGTNKFINANGTFKQVNEIAGILNETLGDLTESELAFALGQMFGSDAVRASTTLMKEGTKGAEEMAKAILKVKAADVAAGKLDNLKGSLTALSGSWDTLLITLGKQGTGPIRGAVDWLNNLLGGAIEAVDGKGFVGGLITTLTGHIGRGDWDAFRNTLGVLIGDGLGKLGEFITPYLPDWVNVIKDSISKGDWSTAGATLKNKIGEGLGTLGDLLGKTWENIKAELSKPIPDDVKTSATNAGAALGNALAAAIKAGQGGTGSGQNFVSNLLGEVGQGILLMAQRGSELGEAFLSGFQSSSIKETVKVPVNYKEAEQSGRDWGTDFMKGLADWPTNWLNMQVTGSRKASTAAVEETIIVWEDNFLRIHNAIWKGPAMLYVSIKGALGGMITAIISGFQAAKPPVDDFYLALQRVKGILDDIMGRPKAPLLDGVQQSIGPLPAGVAAPQNNPIYYPLGSFQENAVGGIIDSPMLTPAGWMGEAGPEALIPLNKLGAMMGGFGGNYAQSGRSPVLEALNSVTQRVGEWIGAAAKVVTQEAALTDGIRALSVITESARNAFSPAATLPGAMADQSLTDPWHAPASRWITPDPSVWYSPAERWTNGITDGATITEPDNVGESVKSVAAVFDEIAAAARAAMDAGESGHQTINVTFNSTFPINPSQGREVARQLSEYLTGYQKLGAAS